MFAYVKLTLLLVFLTLTIVPTATAQQLPSTISVNFKNVALEDALLSIRSKAGFSLRYNKDDLKNAKRVTLFAENWPVFKILDSIFSTQPLRYSTIGNTVLVKLKPTDNTTTTDSATRFVSGKVTDLNKDPIAGASISSGNRIVAITDQNGVFRIPFSPTLSPISITCINCQPQSVDLGSDQVDIVMNRSVPELEPITTATYVPMSKPKNTGSVFKVSANDMGQQPGKSLPDNLSGVVPGLLVKRSNGTYGSSSQLQVRGENRIGLLNPRVKLPSNTPLIVVDGVPLPSMANIITQLPSPAGNPDISSATIGGLSQLRFINMDDIETIVVLKDADATAIYGSRGANGVILIETRKARSGTPNLTVNLRQGIARAPSYLKLMNAAQYIAMRKEAFGNDKLTITETNAPDLAAWNSNNDKDYTKLLMGNTAAITNVHTSISGWSELASYHLDLGYYRQGSVFPGKTVDKNFYDRDIFLHGNISLQSKNKKLSSSFTGLHTSGRSNSIGSESFLQGRLLAPNAPDLLDTNNKLIWPSNLFNPYSYLLQGYQADIENTLGNFKVNYKPGKDFTIKGNFGLNLLNVDEHNILPIAAQNPETLPTGTTITASNFIKTYVFELTAEKTFHFKQWNFMLLGGGTINRQSSINNKTTNAGFASDALLDIPSAAQDTKTTSNNTEYKYAGALGALHFELKDRYILNLTGRRDGSSRYGAANRYGNFGAAGFTWILSREKFLSSLPWLQLAKLRASYGITGNDQIGDYMYIDAWNQVSSPRNYGGITGFTPTSHYNENYQWELCRKFEVAAELAFNHQWSFIFSYYNNLSSNQLITQNVTSQTGFGSIAARNADVKVVNRGFEYYLEKQSSQRGKYHWTIALIGTIPVNKLISFPGLNESLYANQLVEGHSITVRKGYIFKGLNQQTGLYEVVDRDNNGLYNTSDYVPFGDKDPDWFGGLRGSLTLKNFMLDFGWEFCLQKGENQLLNYSPARYISNGNSNLPVDFLDRWQKPGDVSTFQKLTTSTNTDAAKAWGRAATSNLSLTNASYLRLKNICLSYTLKPARSTSKGALQYKLYLLAENAVTITKYKGADPATLNPSGLPILKRFSAGIQISFK